jgi:hypothetical protein
MMHSLCIAAFRAPTGRRFSPARPPALRVGRPRTARLTALADGHIHQCTQRQASPSAIPAFYTLCGSLVPAGNVACTDARVTCPECRRRAS